VKKYKDAKMGTQLHGLKVGEHVEVKGPNQQWRHVPGKYKQYTMVAGGTGITPLIQATRCILAKDTAKVKMITFNKTSSDVLLKDELDYLAKTYPGRLEVVHYVETGDKAGCKQASRDCMPRALKDNLPGAAEGSLVMVCGPQAMTAAVAGPKTPDFKQGDVGGHLKELGYTSNMVWKV
jgi:cytochrome-b5 reductase